jgi:hypothetical protein
MKWYAARTDPETGVELVGYGIMDCGIPMGDNAFIYTTLDKAADTICLDIPRLIEDISEHSNHASFSMTFYFCTCRVDF